MPRFSVAALGGAVERNAGFPELAGRTGQRGARDDLGTGVRRLYIVYLGKSSLTPHSDGAELLMLTRVDFITLPEKLWPAARE